MYSLTKTDTMTRENKASHEVAKKLKAVVENECLPYI